VTAKKMKGRDSLRKIKAASLSSLEWGCRVLKVTRYNKEQNLLYLLSIVCTFFTLKMILKYSLLRKGLRWLL
jgi:hypothetical protein